MLYVFSWFFLQGGVGRGGSCQSCGRQGLIRDDPSLVVACTTGHPHTAKPPTLTAFWTGVWWPVSPGFPCGSMGGRENHGGAFWPPV